MSPDYTQLRLSVSGPRADIVLDRPSALNAITPTMLEELNAALADVANAAGDAGGVRVLVITGEGRAFSAGVDLKALGGAGPSDGQVGDRLDSAARSAIAMLGRLPIVTVAKVNGFCFTGALELAMGCDVIVAANEAKFGDTHAKWGLRPTWGMSQRLPHFVGHARARLLSYTARPFTGAEAHEWGLAAVACPRHDLDAVVDALVEEIAANSAGSIAAYKQLYAVAQDTLEERLAVEANSTFRISDTQERVGGFR